MSSLSYHANLQLNQIAHANGVTTTHALDPNQMARPASISTTAGWSTGSYLFDGAGNLSKIGSSWYLYDGVSRLVQSSTQTGLGGGGTPVTQNLGFDAFGNLQSITNNGVIRSTPTSGSTNRLTGSVSYDGAGTSMSSTHAEKTKLDELEQEIEDSLDQILSKSARRQLTPQQRELWEQRARAALRKDERINIRITRTDLDGIKRRAANEGMPYQTLVASLIHKYVTGQLIEREDEG